MANPKHDDQVDLGGVTYSREELRAMFREAKRRGRESLRLTLIAKAVRYDLRSHRVVLSLSNRSELSIPVELLQGLSDATPTQRKEVVVMPVGTAIEWPQLDQQFSVAGLLAGVFGTKSWMRKIERLTNNRFNTAKNSADRKGRHSTESAALA